MTHTSPTGYDRLSKLNHWILAGSMLFMLGLGFFMEMAPLDREARFALMGLHKAAGVLVLAAAIWRVGYRLWQGFVPEAAPAPRLQALAAKAVHVFLLIALIGLPLSGLVGSIAGGRAIDVFGLLTIPGLATPLEAVGDAAYALHGLLAYGLVAALLLHVGGALKHHLVDRDSTLRRMLPGRAQA